MTISIKIEEQTQEEQRVVDLGTMDDIIFQKSGGYFAIYAKEDDSFRITLFPKI